MLAGHGLDRAGCWATRHTAPRATAPTYVGVGSGASSRSRKTRPPTGARRDPRADDHPRSTRRRTSSATPWSAASTCSSTTAAWPPATTNSPSATRPPARSPRSTSGCAAWNGTYETQPKGPVEGDPPVMTLDTGARGGFDVPVYLVVAIGAEQRGDPVPVGERDVPALVELQEP